MPSTCWAPGCTTGYRRNEGQKKHMFNVPSDPERLAIWQRRIPRDGKLTPQHHLCELHFEEHFIIKTYSCVINGQKVELDRVRWLLTDDAVPTIFPNLPRYLSSKRPKPRRPKQRLPGKVAVSNSFVDCQSFSSVSGIGMDFTESNSDPACPSTAETIIAKECTGCRDLYVLKVKYYQLTRRSARQRVKIRRLNLQVRSLMKENRELKKKVVTFDEMPPKIKLVVQQTQRNMIAKSKHGTRYSTDWILDALLIRCKSTKVYNMLRLNGYLPLPSVSTLNATIKAMRPEFGFTKALSSALTVKLSSFPEQERRGILMFDEMQISKNIDFRVDTGKLVGMVDFGDLTTDKHVTEEGSHALVFLFRPHMGGWAQTIGCFCSAATTPTEILAKLILQAVILLENCGAKVDGLVCDGSSTNRAALKSFGFCGVLENVQHKMTNPCDDSRSLFFFCDMPHLLKTIRNNLLRAKEFEVCIFTNFC